jgi:hypothetical protein
MVVVEVRHDDELRFASESLDFSLPSCQRFVLGGVRVELVSEAKGNAWVQQNAGVWRANQRGKTSDADTLGS